MNTIENYNKNNNDNNNNDKCVLFGFMFLSRSNLLLLEGRNYSGTNVYYEITYTLAEKKKKSTYVLRTLRAVCISPNKHFTPAKPLKFIFQKRVTRQNVLNS